MATTQHFGLYFITEHVQQARRRADREPFQAAWELLRGDPPDDDLSRSLWGGLRYRFEGDSASGEIAAEVLLRILPADTGEIYFDALGTALGLGQSIELLRDHPAFAPYLDESLNLYRKRVDALSQPPEDAAPFERLWLGALNVAAGVVLEDDALFGTGAQTYRDAIDHAIHPEGYIREAVEGGEGGYVRQMLSVAALTLAAEAALHAGVDLWGYANRGVSIVTAGTYVTFYFHFPEKWRWKEDLTPETTRALFRQRGAFMEMLNRQASPRDAAALLDEMHPLFDAYSGGLTTLTHGGSRKHGLFG